MSDQEFHELIRNAITNGLRHSDQLREAADHRRVACPNAIRLWNMLEQIEHEMRQREMEVLLR